MALVRELLLSLEGSDIQDAFAVQVFFPEVLVEGGCIEAIVPKDCGVERVHASCCNCCRPLLLRSPAYPFEMFCPHPLVRLRHQPPTHMPIRVVELLNLALVHEQPSC